MDARNAKRKIFLTALEPNPTLSAGRDLLDRHALDHFQRAETLRDADIVLYLEHGYVGVAELPRLLGLVRSAPSAMHFVFSESDWPFPVLPGAYPSLRTAYPWAHSWAFLPRPDAVQGADEGPSGESPDFLFSFLGRSSTHPVRRQVLSLDSAMTPCLDVSDGPGRFPGFDYSKTYEQLIQRSRFVLCPRGFGASSIRIFEAMRLGRVPVIISDEWQQPPGIDWSEFCVLVPERDVLLIRGILAREAGRARAMGQAGQRVFDECFAPAVFFDRMLTMLLSKCEAGAPTTESILRRVWRVLGWREIRTLGHQARSRALNAFAIR